MEYAAHPPRIPSRRTMLAPVVALALGAAAATGTYALIDNGDEAVQASRVIVVENPASGAADIPGKNEAGTAAAIAPASKPAQIAGKDESATAAAISQSGGVELRGSKASASTTTGDDADAARRTDPHGTASSLRNP